MENSFGAMPWMRSPSGCGNPLCVPVQMGRECVSSVLSKIVHRGGPCGATIVVETTYKCTAEYDTKHGKTWLNENFLQMDSF